MKRCPECRRDYTDDTLSFCLEDGTQLVQGSVPIGQMSVDEPATAILHQSELPSESPTRAFSHTTDQTAILQTGEDAKPRSSLGGSSEKQSFSANRAAKPLAIFGVAVLLLIAGFFGYRYFKPAPGEQINSIAVLPFENRSGSTDDFGSLKWDLSQFWGTRLNFSQTSTFAEILSKNLLDAKHPCP